MGRPVSAARGSWPAEPAPMARNGVVVVFSVLRRRRRHSLCGAGRKPQLPRGGGASRRHLARSAHAACHANADVWSPTANRVRRARWRRGRGAGCGDVAVSPPPRSRMPRQWPTWRDADSTGPASSTIDWDMPRAANCCPTCRWRALPLGPAMRVGLLDAAGREFLAGRIIVPELRSGQPVWLVGRLLDRSGPASEHQDEPPPPKYLGLRGSRPLLGLEQARESPTVIATEGVFDLLALRRWGFPSGRTHGHPRQPRRHGPAAHVPARVPGTGSGRRRC